MKRIIFKNLIDVKTKKPAFVENVSEERARELKRIGGIARMTAKRFKSDRITFVY